MQIRATKQYFSAEVLASSDQFSYARIVSGEGKLALRHHTESRHYNFVPHNLFAHENMMSSVSCPHFTNVI